MKIVTLLKFAVGAAGGYSGARALIAREQLPDQIPAPVREPLERLGARLRAARIGATSILVEVERTRAAAEQELTADYRQRQGRTHSNGAKESGAMDGDDAADNGATPPQAAATTTSS